MNTTSKIAGILAPLFALRGNLDLGVGDTSALLELLKWASQHGFGAIQLLPINETGKSNSPYDALSAIALEPSTITTHPSWMPDLSVKEYNAITSSYDLEALRAGKVQYVAVKALKQKLLTAAWKSFSKKKEASQWQQFLNFQAHHSYWLPDYTLYRTLLERYGNQERFSAWPVHARQAALAYEWLKTLPKKERVHLETRRQFYSYVQWIAWSQWEKILKKAESLGILLIGDIPIGIHIAGAEVFSKPSLFDINSFGGAPPEKVFATDKFTKKWGQNWGIPLYRWETMSHDNFQWWRQRLRFARSLFHVLRVDHALGLFRIYTFPWSPRHNARFTNLTKREAQKITHGNLPHFTDYADDTPEHRKHNEKRGEMLLRLFLEETGPQGIIAEDLGETPSYVPAVLSRLNISGFKLPHWTYNADKKILPGNCYPYFSLATYATHDHEPLRKQWESWQKLALKRGTPATTACKTLTDLLCFAGLSKDNLTIPYPGKIHQALLKALYATRSWLAVVMITDLFAETQQFNIPGALSKKNWRERINFPIACWDQQYESILAASDMALKTCQRFK